jgi:hypothetical protein
MALEKAIITNSVTGERIPVMFNPEEYMVSRDNNFASTAIPGLSAPILQFVNGGQQSLEMELFLDTYEAHADGSRVLNTAGQDVRTLSGKLIGLMDINPGTHAPPVVLFTWASLTFTCVLARASQRFIMFVADGTPVRARIQVTFNEYRNVDLEAREIKRETADYSKIHLVVQGETLSSIAGATYGNPQLWRAIAVRNGIDDPRTLPIGLGLIVPQLPYQNPETGEVYQ